MGGEWLVNAVGRVFLVAIVSRVPGDARHVGYLAGEGASLHIRLIHIQTPRRCMQISSVPGCELPENIYQ